MIGAAIAVAVAACVFLGVVLAVRGVAEASLWAAVVGAMAAVVAATAAFWPLFPRAVVSLAKTVDSVPEWVVDRPEELESVVGSLVRGREPAVAITTALYGAGGFGKTTLALMVCADRRVQRRFGDRVHVVTVGRDLTDPVAIAAKVNDAIRWVSHEDASFTDPQVAGRRLASLLNSGPNRLLVLDDVWTPAQLDPFTAGGRRCVRLVTTRDPGLLAGRGVLVYVDQMSVHQARSLLTAGLPPLKPDVVDGLLDVTGQWPLLLRLVNKILADYARLAPDVAAEAGALLRRLRVDGPTAVDELLPGRGLGLNVGQPQERAQAVRATIGASTSLLDTRGARRFAELAVFAEDERVPFSLVCLLWQATAGMERLAAAQLCQRLAQLALISIGPNGAVEIHDVVRDFLRGELGHAIAELSEKLVDAVAAGIPLTSTEYQIRRTGAQTAWWELGSQNTYMLDHLIEHLIQARRLEDAESVAEDLRWVSQHQGL